MVSFNGVHFVLIVIFTASAGLILVILIKRQILRMWLIGKGGPHTSVGSGAPKEIFRAIEANLDRLSHLRVEPRMLADQTAGLSPQRDYLQNQEHVNDTSTYLYRMKAVDSMTCLDDILCSADIRLGRRPDQSVKEHLNFLLQPPYGTFIGSEEICEEVINIYEHARYQPKEFGESNYHRLSELVETLKNRLKRSMTVPGALISTGSAITKDETKENLSDSADEVTQKGSKVVYESQGDQVSESGATSL